MKRILAFLVTVLVLCSISFSKDVKFEYDQLPDYNFDIALGYSQTSGNTNTKALNLKSTYVKKKEKYRIYLFANGMYAESNDIKMAEEIDLKTRFEYRKARTFFFWDIRYYRNPFQNFTQRLATGPGIGYYFSHSEKFYLTGSYYLYYYKDKVSNTISYTDRYFMHNVEERFKYSLSSNLALRQKLIYSLNNENSKDYYIDFELSLINNLTEHLSLSIVYSYNYQNQPKEAGIKRTDTAFTTNIIISF